MKEQLCSSCGKRMETEARFCSACGTKLPVAAKDDVDKLPSQPNNSEQLDTAATDMAATDGTANKGLLHVRIEMPVKGYDGDKEPAPPAPSKRSQIPKFLLGILVLLLIGGTYYYYDLSRTTQLYLENSAATAAQISSGHAMLTSHFSENISPQEIASLKADIEAHAIDLEAASTTWSAHKCPSQYQTQQKYMRSLLDLESSIFQQIPVALDNPLSPDTDPLLISLQENMTQIDQLCTQIQLPEVTITSYPDLLLIPGKITDFCTEQRRIYQAKLELLNKMTAFFNKMDTIIQNNNAAKTDLNSMLDKIRSGGYGWEDYFALLDTARNKREELRGQVTALAAPAGTEGLKAELSRLLALAVDYCDIMKVGANFEKDEDYLQANEKYLEAQKLNDKIQSQYGALVNKYSAEKTRLTNIDNL